MEDPGTIVSNKWWPTEAMRDAVLSLSLAVGLATVCHATVAEARFIPSLSMAPTLEIGDRLLIEKVSYRLVEPKRGDIVVFHPPESAMARNASIDPAIPWIKRIVALPGERVAVEGGRVLVNGKLVNEPYLGEAPTYRFVAHTVRPGHVFVLGDNRNHSIDSHDWGTLPTRNIIGRASFRFWPPARFGNLRLGSDLAMKSEPVTAAL